MYDEALPVKKEIVVEPHVGVGAVRFGSLEMAAGPSGGGSGGVRGRGERRKKEGEKHGVAVAAAVWWSEYESTGFAGEAWR